MSDPSGPDTHTVISNHTQFKEAVQSANATFADTPPEEKPALVIHWRFRGGDTFPGESKMRFAYQPKGAASWAVKDIKGTKDVYATFGGYGEGKPLFDNRGVANGGLYVWTWANHIRVSGIEAMGGALLYSLQNYPGLIIENCRGRGANVVVQPAGAGQRTTDVMIRGNVIHDCTSSGSHRSGIFLSSLDVYELHDNVLHHNGWNIDGSADKFNHGLYQSGSCWPVISTLTGGMRLRPNTSTTRATKTR